MTMQIPGRGCSKPKKTKRHPSWNCVMTHCTEETRLCARRRSGRRVLVIWTLQPDQRRHPGSLRPDNVDGIQVGRGRRGYKGDLANEQVETETREVLPHLGLEAAPRRVPRDGRPTQCPTASAIGRCPPRAPMPHNVVPSEVAQILDHEAKRTEA